MARADIPSIIVHNGSTNFSGSASLENSADKLLKSTKVLLKQNSLIDEFDENEEFIDGTNELSSPVDESGTVFKTSSLPVTPTLHSPNISPSVNTEVISDLQNSQNSSPSLQSQSASEDNATSDCNLQYDGVSRESVTDGKNSVSNEEGPSFRSKSFESALHKYSNSDKDNSPNNFGRNKHYHTTRLKLLQRSRALQEDSSPPPPDGVTGSYYPPYQPQPGYHSLLPSTNTLTVCPPSGPFGHQRRKIRNQGSSSRGSSFEGSSSPCLSRDSSTEYTDNTGIDLVPFIIQTLHKNHKDRLLLLKIEKELVNMVKDPKRTYHKFPHMSSYQRMLVHRIAAFFGMEHNVDQVGTCVIVNKTRNTRLPEVRFRELIRGEELLPPEEPRRSILRRGYASFDEEPNYKSPDRSLGYDCRRSKSFEEREQEYEKVRRRIFEECYTGEHQDRYYDSFVPYTRSDSSCEDSNWKTTTKSYEEARKRYHDCRRIRSYKGESLEYDVLSPRSLRPPVFKSNSFGGYSEGVMVLSRGNSVASNPPRLNKQDSGSSKFSDLSNSSGYKTQRQDTSSSTNMSTTMSTSPSPTTSHFHQFQSSYGQAGGPNCSVDEETQPVIWAVTDVDAIPLGALLINPQSGQPLTNADGTLYRYDPVKPPPIQKICSSNSKGNSEHTDAKSHPKQVGSLETDENFEESSCNGKDGDSSNAFDEDQQTSQSPASLCQSTAQKYQDETFSEESATDLGSQFVRMNLKESNEDVRDIETYPQTAEDVSAATGQGFSVSKNHSYAPALYYVPPGSVQNLPGGGVKYIYPPYQNNAGSAGCVIAPTTPGSALPGAAMGVPHHMVSLPPTIGGLSGNSQHTMTDCNSQGYALNNYTLVSYPAGMTVPTSSSSTGAHESCGTTYYCPVAPPPFAGPQQGATTVQPPPSGTVNPPAITVAQYSSLSAGSPSYPMALNYCSTGVVPSNALFPNTLGMQQPFQGPAYGSAPVQSNLCSQGAYRAPSPPQNSSTQGLNVGMGFSGSSGLVPAPSGVGSQYVTILPGQTNPNQGPNPHSSGNQIFPPVFRPPIQAVWRNVTPGENFDPQRRS